MSDRCFQGTWPHNANSLTAARKEASVQSQWDDQVPGRPTVTGGQNSQIQHMKQHSICLKK